jgi:hypothetical protein
MTKNLPPVGNEGASQNAASIALLESWLADDATDEVRPKEETRNMPATLLRGWLRDEATDDPEQIRKAQEELDEFKRNMNASHL